MIDGTTLVLPDALSQPPVDPSPTVVLAGAMAMIKARPDLWDQSEWRCETGFCLAGWYAEIDPRVSWASDDLESPESILLVERDTGEKVPVSTWFRQSLGLSQRSADIITDPGNALDDLEWMVADVLDKRVVGLLDEE